MLCCATQTRQAPLSALRLGRCLLPGYLRHVPLVGCMKPNRRAGIQLGDKGDGDPCTNGLTDPENTGSRLGPA